MALTRDQIISTVLTRAGNRSNDAVLTAAAKTEIVLVQSELESEPFLPWFIISTEQTFTITSGDPNITLPSDFLREYEDEDMWYYNASSSPTKKKLEKMDIDDMTQWLRSTEANEPRAYAIVGGQMILGPVPNDAAALGSIKTRYYQRANVLSDLVSTNAWTLNADWLLVNRLGELMATQYIRDKVLGDAFAERAKMAYAKIIAAHVAREQANRRAQMGGNDR